MSVLLIFKNDLWIKLQTKAIKVDLFNYLQVSLSKQAIKTYHDLQAIPYIDCSTSHRKTARPKVTKNV